MAYPTRWYSSDMGGAPVVSGTAGAGVAWLDAVLVNGFNTKSVTISVTSEVATVSATSHGFLQWSVCEITGVTDKTDLNGQKRILTASANSFTFSAVGVANGSATGTITAKVPGAGWTIAFTGTNKRVYRNNSVTGTGGYLRVDDTGTLDMRVTGNMSMTDIDTGSDTCPSAAQLAGGGYFRKSNTASTAARDWVIVADDLAMYSTVDTSNAGADLETFFGDPISLSGGVDAWGFAVCCGDSAGGASGLNVLSLSTSTRMWCPRLYNGTVGSLRVALAGMYPSASGPTAVTYPSPITGGVIASDLVFTSDGGTTFRGRMPGYVQLLNSCVSSLAKRTPLFLNGITEPVILLEETFSGAYGCCIKLGSWR